MSEDKKRTPLPRLICLTATSGKVLFNNRPITREEDELIVRAYNTNSSHLSVVQVAKTLIARIKEEGESVGFMGSLVMALEEAIERAEGKI